MANLQDIDLLKVGHTIQLSGAIYTGEGKVYLVMFPDDCGYLNDTFGNYQFVPQGADPDEDALSLEVLDLDSDGWKQFLRQTDLLETEVLSRAKDGKITKAVLRKSARQIEQGVSWTVFKRDGYQCRYCGNDSVPLTVDHLVLWEEGGPSIEENLVAACRKCNKIRGNTPYADWLQHPHYQKVSRNLSDDVRQANEAIISTLDAIPKRLHTRSR